MAASLLEMYGVDARYSKKETPTRNLRPAFMVEFIIGDEWIIFHYQAGSDHECLKTWLEKMGLTRDDVIVTAVSLV